MTLGQIKERLQTREYDFLRTDEHLGRHFVAAFFAINYLKYVWIANFGTEYNREQIPWAGGEYPAQAVQTF